MAQYHGYQIHEIEKMIPWEREVYTTLVQQYVEEENRKRKQGMGNG